MDNKLINNILNNINAFDVILSERKTLIENLTVIQKQNNNEIINESIFLLKFIRAIELLLKKVFENLNNNKETLAHWILNSSVKLESNIILLSYALEIINESDFTILEKMKEIRNNTILVHPFNNLNLNVKEYINTLNSIIYKLSITNKKNGIINNLNQDEIDSIIKFVKIFYEKNNKTINEFIDSKEFKKIISIINKSKDINLIFFFIRWIWMNSDPDKAKKDIGILLSKITFDDKKVSMFFNYLNEKTPSFISLNIFSILINENNKLIVDYEEEFLNSLDSNYLKWKNEQTPCYDFRNVRSILNDEKLIHKLLNLWLKIRPSEISNFYFWLLLDGTDYTHLISYSIYNYERIIFNHKTAKEKLKESLINRQDLVERRIIFNPSIKKQFIEIGVINE